MAAAMNLVRGSWVRLIAPEEEFRIIGRALAWRTWEWPALGAVGRVQWVERDIHPGEVPGVLVLWLPPWSLATTPQMMNPANLEPIDVLGDPVMLRWWLDAV